MPSRSPPVRVGPLASPAGSGQESHRHSNSTPKGCISQGETDCLPLLSLSIKLVCVHLSGPASSGAVQDCKRPRRVFRDSPTLVQTRLKQQIHKSSNHSFLLLNHLPNFQPFHTCPLLHPFPTCHPATYRAGRSLPQIGLSGPVSPGLPETLCAPGLAATRPGSLQSLLQLPHIPHGHPTARPPGHATARPLDHATACPLGHATSRLLTSLGHVPTPSSRPPGHVPTPTANPVLCTGCTVLTGKLCSWEPSRRSARSPEGLSWSCMACRHAVALYSKRRSGSISRAAGFVAGWSSSWRMNQFSAARLSLCCPLRAEAHMAVEWSA